MPWIVDGNNVAGGSGREKARRAVLAIARRERLRVVLFFDGSPPQGSPDVEYLGSVEVRYVPNADSAILAYLQEGGRGWRVVTSDRDLATQARHLGAEVMSAEAFWEKVVCASNPAHDKRQVAWNGKEDYRSGVTPLSPQPARIRRRKGR